MERFRNNHSLTLKMTLCGLTLFLNSCGGISSEIKADFKRGVAPSISTGTQPFFGFPSADLSQTQGQFKLSASIGNVESVPVQESGAYKLYGGFSGAKLAQ